jgi:hypothetical protein
MLYLYSEIMCDCLTLKIVQLYYYEASYPPVKQLGGVSGEDGVNKRHILVRFEGLRPVTMKNAVFLDVAPCGSYKSYRA